MRIGRYLKTPAEVKRYSIEYGDWLDTGEYVSSALMTISPTTSPALAILSQSIPVNGTSLSFFISGGLADTTYTVDVKMTTSAGQVKEDTITFVV